MYNRIMQLVFPLETTIRFKPINAFHNVYDQIVVTGYRGTEDKGILECQAYRNGESELRLLHPADVIRA